MTFYVGQKVVCVDAHSVKPGDEGRRWIPGEEPIEGAIYTIRRIWKSSTGSLVFDFFELSRDARSSIAWGYEVGYGSFRFRPVIERKTDISIFTAMLAPNKVNA